LVKKHLLTYTYIVKAIGQVGGYTAMNKEYWKAAGIVH
jgi:hypothetical protein